MGLSDYIGTGREIPRLMDNGDNEKKHMIHFQVKRIIASATVTKNAYIVKRDSSTHQKTRPSITTEPPDMIPH